MAKVLDSRRQAREALGRDPEQVDLFDSPLPKKSPRYMPLSQPAPELRRDESIGVLTLGEAAARLGLSRDELERLIEARKIETVLVGGLTRMIPTREVERLATRR